jgi:two-component system, sensor histidine kinase
MLRDDGHSVDQRILVLPATHRDGEVTSLLFERAGLHCVVCSDVTALAAQIELGVGTIVLTDSILSDPEARVLVGALRNQPTWSDIPIVLAARADPGLTGDAQLLKDLTNVTLVDRPTSARTLISAVQAALRTRMRQYQIRNQIEALREAEDALRSADRRKDEFLAMLAHELRNPLAPILSASELLERALQEDAHNHSILQIVKRQARHLTRLVDDLLDVARITQGRIQLQRKPLELSRIISEALESVGPLLHQKQHQVILIPQPEPLHVNGDAARLVQCLTNVLTNAAKYTDSGGQIRVEARRELAAALIVITDNGVGISKELLPRIFDLFVQSERSLDRAQGGLGVGLSVVKALIEMHDGEVSVHSAGPGSGSRFEIRLPLMHVDEEIIAATPVLPTESRRILIVDDNVDAAESLALLLRLDGHDVSTAHTAVAALEQVTLVPSDVVLVDIGLPGMDGYELARQIRATGSRARLVALTGYGQVDAIERGRAAGFEAHLLKPVDLPSLHEILRCTPSTEAR